MSHSEGGSEAADDDLEIVAASTDQTMFKCVDSTATDRGSAPKSRPHVRCTQEDVELIVELFRTQPGITYGDIQATLAARPGMSGQRVPSKPTISRIVNSDPRTLQIKFKQGSGTNPPVPVSQASPLSNHASPPASQVSAPSALPSPTTVPSFSSASSGSWNAADTSLRTTIFTQAREAQSSQSDLVSGSVNPYPAPASQGMNTLTQTSSPSSMSARGANSLQQPEKGASHVPMVAMPAVRGTVPSPASVASGRMVYFSRVQNSTSSTMSQAVAGSQLRPPVFPTAFSQPSRVSAMPGHGSMPGAGGQAPQSFGVWPGQVRRRTSGPLAQTNEAEVLILDDDDEDRNVVTSQNQARTLERNTAVSSRKGVPPPVALPTRPSAPREGEAGKLPLQRAKQQILSVFQQMEFGDLACLVKWLKRINVMMDVSGRVVTQDPQDGETVSICPRSSPMTNLTSQPPRKIESPEVVSSSMEPSTEYRGNFSPPPQLPPSARQRHMDSASSGGSLTPQMPSLPGTAQRQRVNSAPFLGHTGVRGSQLYMAMPSRADMPPGAGSQSGPGHAERSPVWEHAGSSQVAMVTPATLHPHRVPRDDHGGAVGKAAGEKRGPDPAGREREQQEHKKLCISNVVGGAQFFHSQ